MQNENSPPGSRSELFSGGGEMGALMRATDWSGTTLGAAMTWPRSLRTCVRIVLNSRHPMFIWWGPNLINLYNDAYTPILGGKHPRALGQPAAVVWREVWHEIGPRAEHAMRRNEGAYDQTVPLILERHGYREETNLALSYSPLPDDEGAIGGLICAAADNTHRAVRERQLSLLHELAVGVADARDIGEACRRAARALETNPHDLPFALIYLVDPDRRHATLAGAAGIAAGQFAAEEIALDGSAFPPLSDVLESREPRLLDLAGFTHRLPGGAWDQPPEHAVLLAIPRPDQMGPSGVLVAALNPYRPFNDGYRDFLERVTSQLSTAFARARRSEEERERAKELAAVDRAKTAFFSNASHEFRTPLSLLLGPLEDMLLRDPATPTVRSDRREIEMIHRNGLRLLKLANTLLDFSRAEAGRLEAAYEPVDLAAYTVDLASTFRSAMEKAGIGFHVECEPLPVPIHIDAGMWEKIVLNLISNAFKYTFAGSITVALRPAAGFGCIRLTVRDTGVGIPAHELPRVFDRFHRIEGQHGRTREGTGIGLALVRDLVGLHRGTVRVESAVGRGSCFTVAIPAGTAHLPADRIQAARGQRSATQSAETFAEEALRWLPMAIPEDPAASRAGTAGAGRVLLADDNADMRDYVRRLLVAQGYAVDAVPDGDAALRAVRRAMPDLVLSDVMMPVLDGFGLLRALRDDPSLRDVPVILVSARASENARVEGLDSGADDYLTKPFSARELLARVGAALKMARLRRMAAEALRERTAELETMLETLPVAVWITNDVDARRIMGNRRADSWLGLPSGANASLSAGTRERPRFRVFRAGREVAPSTLAMHRAAHGEEVREDETEIRFEDGTSRTLLIYASPLRDMDGHAIGAVGAGLDISERKQREEQIQAAVKEKELLLAEIHHRVKNNLQIVYSLLTLQAGRIKDITALNLLRESQNRIRSMAMIHQTLYESRSFAKVEFGKFLRMLAPMLIESYAIDPSRVELAVGAEHVMLPIDVAIPCGLAVNELISNALKHGFPDGRHGKINVDLMAVNNGMVNLMVRDDGVGISEHIDVYGAETLGLQLVSLLGEQLGGEVTIQRANPTLFTLRFPINPTNDDV